jgi:hypothetical protein
VDSCLRGDDIVLAPTTRLAVRNELPFCPLTVSRSVGVQPQGDVGRLHRFPYHPHQIIAKCVQICFVAELAREGYCHATTLQG